MTSPMGFLFNEEHEMVRKMAREFAAKEIAPRVKEFDRKQELDPELLPKMAAQGFLGICLPARYGGAGMDYISLGIVSEEMEYADTAARVIMSVHVGLNSLGIFQWGTEEQKQRLLAPQARGEKIACFCRPCDPRRGARAMSTSSTARRFGSAWPM